MSTAQTKINASLLGDHGIVQQLRAYALVREERPIYLLKYIEAIEDCIEMLDENERRAIEYCYLKGYSIVETAKQMQVQPTFVATLIAEAHYHLRDSIDLAIGNYYINSLSAEQIAREVGHEDK